MVQADSHLRTEWIGMVTEVAKFFTLTTDLAPKLNNLASHPRLALQPLGK